MNFTTSYQEEFVQALLDYVGAALRNSAVDPDYCQEAVQGIYALRDLCVLDDERMCLVPDAGRCRSVARDFGMNR